MCLVFLCTVVYIFWPWGYKTFSGSIQLSMEFFMLINLNLLTIANSFLLNIAKHGISLLLNMNNIVGIFIFVSRENFNAQLNWAWKKVYNLGARSFGILELVWFYSKIYYTSTVCKEAWTVFHITLLFMNTMFHITLPFMNTVFYITLLFMHTVFHIILLFKNTVFHITLLFMNTVFHIILCSWTLCFTLHYCSWTPCFTLYYVHEQIQNFFFKFLFWFPSRYLIIKDWTIC